MTMPFPLLTLSPVSDTRNAWAAMLLETPPEIGGAALGRIFDDFGLGRALGPLPCVVALPDLSALDVSLPVDRIVLSMPAQFCCDRANDEALRLAQAKGFRLMANGLPGEGETLFEGVAALALPCSGWNMAPGMMALLKRLPGPHLAFTTAEFNCPGRCHFQWLVRQPTDEAPAPPVHGKSVDATNRLLLLELLSQVANDADSHEIEATVKRDPQLSYHLLKLVNSVAFSLTTKISSFNQAITLLGRRQLQRWLQLLLYARSHGGDMANPLLPRAALRAGLTEALCAVRGGSRDEQDRAFMAGMFSLLGVLFGMPLAEVVKPLNLADDVAAALTERTGRLGALLRVAEAAEKTASRDALPGLLGEAGLSPEDWARSLIHACEWAIQISREA